MYFGLLPDAIDGRCTGDLVGTVGQRTASQFTVSLDINNLFWCNLIQALFFSLRSHLVQDLRTLTDNFLMDQFVPAHRQLDHLLILMDPSILDHFPFPVDLQLLIDDPLSFGHYLALLYFVLLTHVLLISVRLTPVHLTLGLQISNLQIRSSHHDLFHQVLLNPDHRKLVLLNHFLLQMLRLLKYLLQRLLRQKHLLLTPYRLKHRKISLQPPHHPKRMDRS